MSRRPLTTELLLCAAALVACGHSPPPSPRSGPPAPLTCEPRAITAEPDAANLGPPPGPTPAELELLARRHHTPTPMSHPSSAPLDLPRDWRSLPQTALLWTHSRGGIQHAAVGEGLVVLSVHGEVSALELRTGAERWQRAVEERRSFAHVAAGCGVVAIIDADAIRALEPADGTVRWEIPYHRPTDDRGFILPSLAGCTLATYGRASAEDGAPLEVLLVDLRAGRIARRVPCAEGCNVTVDAEHALVRSQRSAPRAVPLDGSAPRQVPAAPQAVIGRHVVTADEGDVTAIDEHGAILWTRPLARQFGGHRFPILARTSGSIVMLEASGLTRVEVSTGVVQWHTPLAADLTGLLTPAFATQDDQRLVLTSTYDAPVALEFDLATGAPTSLRAMPIWPEQIAISGDVLIARSRNVVVGIDRSREAPPMRSELSPEDDLQRTLRALAIEHVEPGPYEGTSWAYPTSELEAQEWLVRLAPLVPDTGARVRARMSRAPLTEAVALLAALGSGGDTDAARIELLQRSWGSATGERAAVRVRVAATLEEPLPPSIADALACETIDWLEAAQRAPAPGELARDIASAIHAGRDLLERASTAAAPLAAVRDAALGDRQRQPQHCAATERDAVIEAAIRHTLELTGPRYPVQAPDARCVHVETSRGLVSLSPVSDAMPYQRFELDESRAHLDFADIGGGAGSHRGWIGHGPFWLVQRSTMVAPLNAEWTLLVVRRVGDEWRVVASVLLAMS